MTIKVEACHSVDVSTAYGSEAKAISPAAPRVVRTVKKAVLVEDHDSINLTAVNRSLRGRREPLLAVTGDTQELETA